MCFSFLTFRDLNFLLSKLVIPLLSFAFKPLQMVSLNFIYNSNNFLSSLFRKKKYHQELPNIPKYNGFFHCRLAERIALIQGALLWGLRATCGLHIGLLQGKRVWTFPTL